MSEQAELKSDSDQNLVEISADIVCAYISHNDIGPEDLPKLISDVHTTLQTLKSDSTAETKVALKPAVSVKKSLTPDYIVCLEDGKKFKSLKRHIRTHYDLSPEEYREKWGLPANYPMVAPSYSKVRSRLARANGLGKKTD